LARPIRFQADCHPDVDEAFTPTDPLWKFHTGVSD
jgi:hypothetical protein